MKPLGVVVIGLGKQSVEDHLPALYESDLFKLLAVLDSDSKKTDITSKQYSVAGFSLVDDLLKEFGDKVDVALVAVPHNEYLPIIKKLAAFKINVIKEKPFATSVAEANELKKIIQKSGISVYITLQRRFNPIFLSFKQLLKRIGKIYSIEGRYTLNIARLDEGWRADKKRAGGGALIDMGYHLVDLIVWYFGLPDSITCRLSTGNRENQKYDVEDTALVNFMYNDARADDGRILGNIVISRVYPRKDESLTVYGSKGSVHVERGKVCRRDINGNEMEVLERRGAWPSAAIDQLEEFGERILKKKNGQASEKIQHFEHIAFIEASYDSNKNHDSRDPNKYLKKMVRQDEGSFSN